MILLVLTDQTQKLIQYFMTLTEGYLKEHFPPDQALLLSVPRFHSTAPGHYPASVERAQGAENNIFCKWITVDGGKSNRAIISEILQIIKKLE